MILEDLRKDLIKAKLLPTDKVLIHSSLKQMGNVDAEDVLDTLIDYFKDGLLLFPTHTWGYIKNNGDTFEVINSKPNVGILPTLFLKREGIIRSLHPTHSMAGIGELALKYLAGEEKIDTPCSPKGVYGRLYDIDAKIILIGVNHVKNTYIHSVEESFNVLNRIANESTTFNIIKKDGTKIRSAVHKHYCSLHPHVSECYQKLDPIFLELEVEYKTKLLAADTTICYSRRIYKVLEEMFKQQKQLLVEEDNIKEQYYQNKDYEWL